MTNSYYVLLTRAGACRGAFFSLKRMIAQAKKWSKKESDTSLFYEEWVNDNFVKVINYIFISKDQIKDVKKHYKVLGIEYPNRHGLIIPKIK